MCKSQKCETIARIRSISRCIRKKNEKGIKIKKTCGNFFSFFLCALNINEIEEGKRILMYHSVASGAYACRIQHSRVSRVISAIRASRGSATFVSC